MVRARKYFLLFIIAIIAVLLMVPACIFLASRLLFVSYYIKADNVPYEKFHADFNSMAKVYEIPIQDVTGGKSYSYEFVKKMDYTCVIRIDGAEQIIRKIKCELKPTNTNIELFPLKFYKNSLFNYDNVDTARLCQYRLTKHSEYRYYITDEGANIVWYVGYSIKGGKPPTPIPMP
jgi:hypothetical protein